MERPSLEGFVNYLITHNKDKQTRLLKFALKRLCKEYPELCPRTYLLNWLNHWIEKYEDHMEKISRWKSPRIKDED